MSIFNNLFRMKEPDKKPEVNEPIMTPDEFYRELQKIWLKCGNDYESSHSEMDDLMCDLLESLGYKDGIEFFKKSHRWYS